MSWNSLLLAIFNSFIDFIFIGYLLKGALYNNESRVNLTRLVNDPLLHSPNAIQQRNLAEIEYDWLAAVVERLFLCLFLVLFVLMSIGLNGIGAYYCKCTFYIYANNHFSGLFVTIDRVDEWSGRWRSSYEYG
jgi:hypothetical protein